MRVSKLCQFIVIIAIENYRPLQTLPKVKNNIYKIYLYNTKYSSNINIFTDIITQDLLI